MDLHQVATVSFQGMVVAFARAGAAPTAAGEGSVRTDVHYNVLSLEVDSASDALDWDGWRRLDLPNEVRPSGMQLINVPAEYSRSARLADLADAGEPFRVFTNQEYIYLLRQAVGGSLLVSRLRLVRQVAAENAEEADYALAPAWEVRFQRSGKPDVPHDDKDVQAYLSPDREPFVEPTLELPVSGVTGGRFDAALLPRGDGTQFTCALAVLTGEAGTPGRMDMFEIPLDTAGRFLLEGRKLDGNRLEPDFSFTLETGGKPLTLSDRPSFTYYLRQERVAGGAGESFTVKRAGRLLLGLRAKPSAHGSKPTLATVDFGTSVRGTLARPPSTLQVEGVGVAPYTLDFDDSAHVQLPDVVVTGGFGVELWLKSQSDAERQFILGNPGDETAPRLSLLEGSRLELVFCDTDDRPFVASTLGPAVRREAWSHVQVSYDPDRPRHERFRFRVNGNVLPHTEIDTDRWVPNGRPMTSLSASSDGIVSQVPSVGFVGSIDSLAVYGAPSFEAADLIGEWPLETVLYTDGSDNPRDPPVTRNTKDEDGPGLVYGAHLVPSTSPAATGDGGALSFDAEGLSIVAGYFRDMAVFDSELGSSPALLASADGLVHAYFQGGEDRFSVMQLDVEAARATFEVPWTTATGPAQRGPVQLIASRAGAFMNEATIEVADPVGGLRDAFCDVTLRSPAPSGRTETWRGVPRSLVSFAATLNGESVGDPSDPRLTTGAVTYFDPTGERTAAYVALPGNVDAALAGFVSRQCERLPLASVQVTAVSDELLDLVLTHGVPRWSGETLVQEWRGVPARVAELLRVLDGASTTYTYTTAPPPAGRAYSIGAESGVMDADTVVFFTRRTVEQVRKILVTAEGAGAADLCTVEIELVDSDAERSATWTDVPRRQDLFARTIEGVNPHYDYDARASGDHEAIGDALVLTTNGNAADVDDVTREDTSGLPSDDDLRVYGSLVEALVTAPVSAADKLPGVGVVTARAFQEAPAPGSSPLFQAHLVAVPSQGSVGLVANTTAQTGPAVLVRQGMSGGWRRRPGERTLTFDGTGCVDFPVDEATAPGIAALTTQGDMTLELWCRPDRENDHDRKGRDERLVTFSRTPTPAEGGERVRYMAGLRDCPSYETESHTSVGASYALRSGTFYTWFTPVATKGVVLPGTIGFLTEKDSARAVVLLSVDADGHIRARFVAEGEATPIVSPQKVTAGRWYQVALTWAQQQPKESGDPNVLLVDLYVDGVHLGRGGGDGWETTRPLHMVRTGIGRQTTLEGEALVMRANEMACFDRRLARPEIELYREQRIPDNAPGLVWKWMLNTGAGGHTAVNSAPTGSRFDVDFGSGSWADFGLYRLPTLGHGTNIARLAGEPVLRGWSHLAMVHQAGHALHLEGNEFADCGHGSTTELGEQFTIEAWVGVGQPSSGRQPVAVVGKGEDYELGYDSERHPTATVKVRGKLKDAKGKLEDTALPQLRGSTPLEPGATHHLALTYEMVAVDVKGATAPRYEVRAALWVDGVDVASGWGKKAKDGVYEQFEEAPARVVSDADLELGRSSLHGGSRYMDGHLSDTRLWSRVLSEAEIGEAVRSRRVPADRDALVSWWRFDEAGGRIAFDVEGNSDARLSRGDLRVGYPSTSTNRFYVDGRAAAPTWEKSDSAVGGWPADDLFAFGRMPGDTPVGFHGQLDSVRIWDTQLTGEQVADSMYRALSGREAHLVGLWNFDNGSGSVVEDRTGRGNAGHLTGDPTPVWATSTAPLGNEHEGVVNILGGVPGPTHDLITETPSVIEYADLQRDAYGAPFSVMKRAYVAVEDGRVRLVTGYKVGDLDTVYLGQAQSRPSVIGFIEGAPPIPSENQTMPYWRGGGTSINTYATASSVAFDEADQTTFVYNADRELAQNHALLAQAGLAFRAQTLLHKGVPGAAVETLVLDLEGRAGGQVGFELDDKSTEGLRRSTGTAITRRSALRAGGAWEPGDTDDTWVNSTVGRRYVPANTGMALVKSLTVDVYASILTTTRSMVKVTSAPNPDIPEDVNILTFPIDPAYVKNGTLDGKVGLEDDPAYPHADTDRGSYFKPLEAYALERRIEREQARLAGYYDQYDVRRQSWGQVLPGTGDGQRRAQRADGAYDWGAHLAKRNIVNTYVWTAAGGTFAEQTSTMNVYTESHGSLAALTGKVGVIGEIEATTLGVGAFGEFDYLASLSTEVTVVRNREESSGFGLSAPADPDGFLYAPRPEDDPTTFTSQPTEGKVDGYRYKAFFLAPSTDNFDELKTRVIDPQWLAQSMDAAAVALREATMASNGAWRVLYRVTYVSRIPPKFQPVPDQTRAPDLQPPANPEYNALLVTLVEREVAKDDPTPLEIGTAIATVLGTAETPGPLAGLLLWWPQFLTDAGKYQLPAGSILQALHEDLLRYMVDTYAYRHATKEPALHA